MSQTVASAHGLIFSANLGRSGRAPDFLQREAQRGGLIRLRRGVYCEASHWAELDDRERYLLRIRSVISASKRALVLCSWSAAAVWGMPTLDGWPEKVHVLSGRASGGRSKNGVRRHPDAHFDPEDPARYGGAISRDGFLVTGVAHTTLDLILDSEFAPAVASLDAALWRKNQFRVEIADVRAEFERRSPRYGANHTDAVLAQGTHLSDSYGESMCRAVIHQLGYPTPELQARFVDQHGEMFSDYFWRMSGVAGEFDGAAKYIRPEYLGTLTPSEVVWREKKRDDRLRRQVRTTVRFTWSDVRNPRALDLMLREAGLVPTRR